MTAIRLAEFTTLTFDCYGTLIDWEGGIMVALQPLLGAMGAPLPREAALSLFARHESEQQRRTPGILYPALLAEVHRQMADRLGVAMTQADHQRFGASVPDWPAFADSAASLRYLKKSYRLVILSNVDRASFAASNERLAVEFDAVYTAQDIGSYKPDPDNFRYLLARLDEYGTAPAKILHTAQSLFHDHVPAQQIGLRTAWIDRRGDAAGGGATMPPPAGSRWDFRFPSLADMVKAHQQDSRA